jgi:hypothetical protein
MLHKTTNNTRLHTYDEITKKKTQKKKLNQCENKKEETQGVIYNAPTKLSRIFLFFFGTIEGNCLEYLVKT